MYYRILPTNSRAMPLECTAETFVNEYRECWEDPERPTNNLYVLVRPFLEHWARMLEDHGYKKDINYVSLCRRLYPITESPSEMIESWCNAAQQTTSVMEELEMLFFARLRRLNYYPKRAAPRMAEYVIAKDFRDRLKDMVLRSWRHPIDIPMEAITSVLVTEDPQPDHLFFKTLGLNEWESYMLELLKLGRSTMEVAALTHIPRRTLLREEQYLWSQLRTKWQQQE
jgi:hypothetical protein